MRAMVIDEYGDSTKIHEADVDAPKVGPDTVLIRTRGIGVNPVDAAIRGGHLDDYFPHRFPITLGWDVAGEVEAVGPAVTSVEVGTPVWAYARKTEVHEGTYADLVSVPESYVAKAPTSIDITDAGAVPLAGLTAWQGLVDILRIEAGETVLIGNGSGGVGHFAVQVAKARGARVITTASPDHHKFVRSLGADEVLDYHRDDLADAVRELAPDGVDAAFDQHGGDSLDLMRGLVREGGRIASLIDTEPAKGRSDITGRYVFVRPSSEDLDHLAALIDVGKLRVYVSERFELGEAAAAHDLVALGHTTGKVLLTT